MLGFPYVWAKWNEPLVFFVFFPSCDTLINKGKLIYGCANAGCSCCFSLLSVTATKGRLVARTNNKSAHLSQLDWSKSSVSVYLELVSHTASFPTIWLLNMNTYLVFGWAVARTEPAYVPLIIISVHYDLLIRTCFSYCLSSCQRSAVVIQ